MTEPVVPEQERPSAEKMAWCLDKIVAEMRDRGLAVDVLVSEIQDWLTIAGYDVPLRSYDHRIQPPYAGPALPAPEPPAAPLVDLADEYISGAHPDSTVAQRPEVLRDFVKWVLRRAALPAAHAPPEGK